MDREIVPACQVPNVGMILPNLVKTSAKEMLNSNVRIIRRSVRASPMNFSDNLYSFGRLERVRCRVERRTEIQTPNQYIDQTSLPMRAGAICACFQGREETSI